MKPIQLLTAGVTTTAALFLLASGSALPVAYHRAEAARLRLSWSARPERIEVCREVSAEEQAKREEHMRQRVECEGRFASYALLVEVDGQAIGETVVRGAGFRNDRPLYLLRDYPVPAGEHRIRVTLIRREQASRDSAAVINTEVPDADTGLYAGRAERETTERRRRTQAAIPPRLTLDTVFRFAPRQVALVSFNAGRRTLELRAEARRP